MQAFFYYTRKRTLHRARVADADRAAHDHDLDRRQQLRVEMDEERRVGQRPRAHQPDCRTAAAAAAPRQVGADALAHRDGGLAGLRRAAAVRQDGAAGGAVGAVWFGGAAVVGTRAVVLRGVEVPLLLCSSSPAPAPSQNLSKQTSEASHPRQPALTRRGRCRRESQGSASAPAAAAAPPGRARRRRHARPPMRARRARCA